MYLSNISIRNIRSIESFEMKFDHEHYPGWHVVLGDNGAGKSTFVRSVALALVGPTEAAALRQDWGDWLRRSESSGQIEVEIDHDPDFDKPSTKGKHVSKFFVPAYINFQVLNTANVHEDGDVLPSKRNVTIKAGDSHTDPYRYVWGNAAGWFSASYGPFRRFSGGDRTYDKLFFSNPKLAAHLTAFGEDVALTEALAWLERIYVRDLEDRNHRLRDQESGRILSGLRKFINKGNLLPHGTQLTKVTSGGVLFRDGTDATVMVDQLSDGYRSILSLTFELIRQMLSVYGYKSVFKKIAYSLFLGPLHGPHA